MGGSSPAVISVCERKAGQVVVGTDEEKQEKHNAFGVV
jgi:hypothetical protein